MNLPLAFFSYKRSLFGIVLTLVALATSMGFASLPHGIAVEIEMVVEVD